MLAMNIHILSLTMAIILVFYTKTISILTFNSNQKTSY